MLTSDSKVVATPRFVSAEVGEEIILLHLENGIYFGLDTVGARIWRLLETPTTVREIEKVLLEEYDVEAERCYEEVLRLLNDLIDEGLVETIDDETMPEK